MSLLTRTSSWHLACPVYWRNGNRRFPVENILEVFGRAMLFDSTGSSLGTLNGAFDQNISLKMQWGVNPSELETQAYASLLNTFDPTGNAVPDYPERRPLQYEVHCLYSSWRFVDDHCNGVHPPSTRTIGVPKLSPYLQQEPYARQRRVSEW